MTGKKNNIRSIRFSDELAELIDRQAGDTFTQKFENLITRCVWELPKKEEQLKRLDTEISKKRDELARLRSKVYRLENDLLKITDKMAALGAAVDMATKCTE